MKLLNLMRFRPFRTHCTVCAIELAEHLNLSAESVVRCLNATFKLRELRELRELPSQKGTILRIRYINFNMALDFVPIRELNLLITCIIAELVTIRETKPGYFEEVSENWLFSFENGN